MSNFEFVFSLLAILLGLALAEILGGLARAVKRRPVLRVGWATGLLATWAIFEIVLFWRVAWRARDYLPDTSPALLVGFAITALYYFAGALLFPDDLERRQTLDDYFMQEKSKVIGALFAAAVIAYGARPAVMGAASWSYMTWFDFTALGSMCIAAVAAILTKRRRAAIACLGVLVLFDALDPIQSIFWPN
ncbi:hypothetical protein [Sphingomonas agri]|uniref:hypothetical protein n=1 Tax=Sphingomonas agri TaxID=1813878 RepID=UPI00311EA2FD